MKTAKDFLEEAHAKVERISSEDAIALHAGGKTVFVDVRDSADIAKTGTIKGALRVPRGFLEFAADSNTQFHRETLKKDADICLVCGAGGQAALSGKTLLDMGFTSVKNVGGIGDWKEAGGPTED